MLSKIQFQNVLLLPCPFSEFNNSFIFKTANIHIFRQIGPILLLRIVIQTCLKMWFWLHWTKWKGTNPMYWSGEKCSFHNGIWHSYYLIVPIFYLHLCWIDCQSWLKIVNTEKYVCHLHCMPLLASQPLDINFLQHTDHSRA